MAEGRPRFPLAALLWVLLAGAACAAPDPAATPAAAEEKPAEDPAADTAVAGAGDTTVAGAGDSVGAETEGEAGEAEADRPPLWVELYSEGVRSRHEQDNAAGFGEVKVGRRVRLGLPVDFYGKARVYRDQRDFFWNNLALGGFGARVHLLASPSLTAYAQVMGGSYLRTSSAAVAMDGLQVRIENVQLQIDGAQRNFQAIVKAVGDADILAEFDDTGAFRDSIRTLIDAADKRVREYRDDLQLAIDSLDALALAKDRVQESMDSLALIPAGEVTEYQAGLVLWHGWGGPQNQEGPWFAFPLRFWGEIYSDCIWQGLRRHVLTRGGGNAYRDSLVSLSNLVFYLNPDVGFLVLDGRAGSAAAYLTGYFWADTHGDWWNNRFMAGPGLKWQPFHFLDFLINVEYVMGRYYRERAEDPNPYAAGFTDLRVGANFWYGLGF